MEENAASRTVRAGKRWEEGRRGLQGMMDVPTSCSTPAIPALERQRKEECELEVCLDCIVRPCFQKKPKWEEERKERKKE